MKKNKWKIYFIHVLVPMFLWGCASPAPDRLTPERIKSIKKVAIVTTATGEGLVLMDRTRPVKKDDFHRPFGATGGLIDELGRTVAEKYATKADQHVDAEVVANQLWGFDVENVLDDKLVRKISRVYDVVEPGYFENKAASRKKPDYFKLVYPTNADLLIRVSYQYGLAAYKNENPGAAIDATISVYDCASRDRLLIRHLRSDELFKKHRTITEFAADNAALYKQDIADAAESLAVFIAGEIGL